MRVNEVWMKPWGDLVYVEWNACGCHPDDVIMTWGKNFYDSGWYGAQNKAAWSRWLKSRGWTRLDRTVIK